MGADFKPFERKLHESTTARARALCGEAEYADALARGAAMPLPEALQLAFDGASPRRSQSQARLTT